MIAQPQQMELDAIRKSIQKNVKNNATVQRTENGNVLLPEGFPADVGGGVDQYGNAIYNMAASKGYVDSHSGGSIDWHSNKVTGKTPIITRYIQTVNVPVNGENISVSVDMFSFPVTGLREIKYVGCIPNGTTGNYYAIGSTYTQSDGTCSLAIQLYNVSDNTIAGYNTREFRPSNTFYLY